MKFLALLAALIILPCAPVNAAPPKLVTPAPINFKPARAARHVLPNGLTVLTLENHALPVIHAYAIIKGGALYDPAQKIGLASFAADALRTGGSKNYPPEEMNSRLEAMGAEVESGAAEEYLAASMAALTRHAPAALEIFADMLRNPAFEPGKTEILRSRFMESLARRNDDPAAAAARESRRRFFGADNPYGWRAETTTVNAITPADLAAWHDFYYKPGAVTLCLAGDFSEADMLALATKLFGDWAGKPNTLTPPPAPAPHTERAVYFAQKDVENAPVHILLPGPARHDPDYFTYRVFNDILGGGFSSRLFNSVRTKMGLAYYAASSFDFTDNTGAFIVSAGTKNSTVPDATRELLTQLELMKQAPPSAAELELAKSQLVNRFAMRFETPLQTITERAQFAYFGYPEGFLENYTAGIRAVTAADVQNFARKWLKPENAVLYIEADEEKLPGPLTEFGAVTPAPLD